MRRSLSCGFVRFRGSCLLDWLALQEKLANARVNGSTRSIVSAQDHSYHVRACIGIFRTSLQMMSQPFWEGIAMFTKPIVDQRHHAVTCESCKCKILLFRHPNSVNSNINAPFALICPRCRCEGSCDPQQPRHYERRTAHSLG